MKTKYFNQTGEIAFRLWMFANAVEELHKTPNAEKAENLRSKMLSFSGIVKKKKQMEAFEDLRKLIKSL